MQCAVPNLAVFKRLLESADGFDALESPTIATVESLGGTMRQVTLVLREWRGQDIAAARAVEKVSAISTSVMGGEVASLMSIKRLID